MSGLRCRGAAKEPAGLASRDGRERERVWGDRKKKMLVPDDRAKPDNGIDLSEARPEKWPG